MQGCAKEKEGQKREKQGAHRGSRCVSPWGAYVQNGPIGTGATGLFAGRARFG